MTGFRKSNILDVTSKIPKFYEILMVPTIVIVHTFCAS